MDKRGYVSSEQNVIHDAGSHKRSIEPPKIESPNICVICLELAPDEASALPCRHDQFHFSCLGTWLNQSRTCPLCKEEVNGIRYRDEPSRLQKVYSLADQTLENGPWSRNLHLNRVRSRRRRPSRPSEPDPAIAFRRYIYEHNLYSCYVGANKYSGYRNVTPETIRADPSLVAKARKWIRRELQVFDFLNPDSPAFGRTDRRATNAEYLLEYMVAIIRSIDLKGSAGQAQELLGDFLGRQNARLFWHELEAWLRSPYESIIEWDQVVQYDNVK